MGRMTHENPLTLIEQVLAPLGISASGEAASKLATYAAEVVRWNRRINLTGAASLEQFIPGPLFDALTLLSVLEDGVDSLVDVGSGGGLPGIPVGILRPGIRLTLVEPRGRRAAFLRHAVHLLSLDAEIIEAQDEALKSHAWNHAVAEAVWAPDVWLGRATRLIAKKGAIYVLTAKPLSPENLPPGLFVEQQSHVINPSNKAQRYSTRVRQK